MEALVWRGLKRTEAWKSLSEAAKKEINKQDNLFLRKNLNKPENCE